MSEWWGFDHACTPIALWLLGCSCIRLFVNALTITSCNVVSFYVAGFGKEHWKLIEWVLRYLHGTFEVY